MALPGEREKTRPPTKFLSIYTIQCLVSRAIDLSEVKRRAPTELKKENNIFNRQLARKYRCGKSIIDNNELKRLKRRLLIHYLQRLINDVLN